MKNIRRFNVVPSLPPALEPLRELAHNLWWSWNHQGIFLFRRIDNQLWEETHHNPIRLLGRVRQERLRFLANDESFRAQLDRCSRALHAYVNDTTWFAKTYPRDQNISVAYFSFEYALTECVQMYSGGMGVLAGDHLKAASDMGIPLVGIGLLYSEGYFQQQLTADGWQRETYSDIDFHALPITLLRQPNGDELRIQVELPDGPVSVRVWRVQVGRVPLYVMDANVAENRPDQRQITARLYGGDNEMRIRQEILLGIGGMRVLGALGIEPTVFHMNEGHSAFLALERIRHAMVKHNIGFRQAHEATSTTNVFTTHTPVPAGNDRFEPALMRKYFEPYRRDFGVSFEEFLALGREDRHDAHEPFCMTVLAIKASDHVNGVSKLHGQVSRHMWQRIWPEVPTEEIPIRSITNGIHTRTWISHDLGVLFDRYLGERWVYEPQDPTVWGRVDQIPDEELWRTHERRRERLVGFARERLRWQLERSGSSARDAAVADEVLNPEALTIGFARRFATYKRATLLFRDMERLTNLLLDRDRPVQLIFAGKAHPQDEAGKGLIRDIVRAVRGGDLRNRVLFLEDYDMAIARYLVQGVDVWLNTPRRPLEASGTSGMKAAVNGVLNLSVLDGWWVEGYRPNLGWAIGRGEEYPADRLAEQDAVESAALYALLEKEVKPLFYERTRSGLPRGWIARMKACMRSVCPYFNTHRMVQGYLDRCYLPAARRRRELLEGDLRRTRALVDWMLRLEGAWPEVRITAIEERSPQPCLVGSKLLVRAVVQLGPLTPDDVAVEVYSGPLTADGQFREASALPMRFVERAGDGGHVYEGDAQCRDAGQHGYTVRVLPSHPDLVHPFEPRLIRWA